MNPGQKLRRLLGCPLPYRDTGKTIPNHPETRRARSAPAGPAGIRVPRDLSGMVCNSSYNYSRERTKIFGYSIVPFKNTKELARQYVEIWIQTRLASGPELPSSRGMPQGRSGGSPPTGPWSASIRRPGIPQG